MKRLLLVLLGPCVVLAACSGSAATSTTTEPNIRDSSTTLIDTTTTTTTTSTTSTTVDVSTVSGPSQSPTEAARDGIVPALAELSLADRVSVIVSESTSEGVWAISEVPGADAPDCLIGDRSGLYGTDFVCLGEYHEVLLLTDDLSQIIRAYPLPGQPARLLLVTDEAVYCARQGDGGLPDSMLCRINRQSLGITGRIFMGSEESIYGPPEGQAIPYGDWTIVPFSPVVVMETLEYDGRIVTTGYDGIAYHDPVTLERLDVDLVDPTP